MITLYERVRQWAQMHLSVSIFSILLRLLQRTFREVVEMKWNKQLQMLVTGPEDFQRSCRNEVEKTAPNACHASCKLLAADSILQNVTNFKM